VVVEVNMLWPNPVTEMLGPEPERERDRPTLASRLRAIARAIRDDAGVREGALQIVTSLAGLAIRALSPKNRTLAQRSDDK
jgi:hypothetical protein